MSEWIKTTLMLEEYLDGPEVDVDLIFSAGQPVYGAITDNWPTVEPYFNETGSNCPSILPASQQQELIQLGVQSVQALGLTLVSLSPWASFCVRVVISRSMCQHEALPTSSVCCMHCRI